MNSTKQYLTFQLGDEVFAIDVANVREILEFTRVTQVPRAPDFMRGVINLRGSVVPVVDMRQKFDMDRTEKTINTCIVVVEITCGSENIVMGALVDSVQEVFELEAANIEPAPRMGTHVRADFIKGMGKRDDCFIIILDTSKVFSSDEFADLSDAKVANE
ncbi:MAG: chemotaxis protein CheW [Syntrophorhabdaceae bacterium]|nr:chemotaxis protein CheW [Syntrophorhabdaceae bacterium]